MTATENETEALAVEVAHVTEMIDEEDLARESVVDDHDLVIGDRKLQPWWRFQKQTNSFSFLYFP